MRILGMDYGRKRVGLAVTDALGITAQPILALENHSTFFQNLKKVIEEQEVSEIVVGYPRSLNGTPGPMALEVEGFKQKLIETTGLPVFLWDERFSSHEANRLLIEADMRREKRKEVRDSIAASLILQGYIQSKSHAK